MSDQSSNNSSNGQIPAGFTPETWEKLTPEQKKQYQQPQGQADPAQMQAQQEKMVKDIKKKAVISMVIGSIFSFIPRRFSGMLIIRSSDYG